MSGERWEGCAVVDCSGAFGTTNGKTAHGLIRRSGRYRLAAVLDPGLSGRDAGEVLDGKPCGVLIVAGLEQARAQAESLGLELSHYLIGLAPDGGRADAGLRERVRQALEAGLHVVSGLHDFFSEDEDLRRLAQQRGVSISDVRRPPRRDQLHFFQGLMGQVEACRIAILGTDSAVGKRTTAWVLHDALRDLGLKVELVGTGQTAWLQGARYSVIMDSLVNDFVSGEIEHAVWRAWQEQKPDVILIEGQGSLLNPAYPGGFEILAAAKPQALIVQHAPARRFYDGFPDEAMHPLETQIQAMNLLSGNKPILAICVNHEDMSPEETVAACQRIHVQHGLPAFDVLRDRAVGLASICRDFCKTLREKAGS